MGKEKNRIVVLGAGLTGLTSGWKLSEKNYNVDIIETANRVGGTSSSFKYKEFLLDIGPHKIYTQLPHILKEIKGILKEDLLEIPKSSSIRLIGKYFDYPLDMKDLLFKMSPAFALKCGLSYGFTAISGLFTKKEDSSYEDYITNRFGKTAYSFVFEPLAEKTWGSPKKLDPGLAKTRVPIPSLFEMLKSILTGKKHKPSMSAKVFYYPKKAIIQLSENLEEKIREKGGNIHLNAKAVEIKTKNYVVESVAYRTKEKKTTVNCSFLMSTIHLKDLVKMIKPRPPKEIIQAVNSLRFRSLILVYLIAGKKRIMKDNWIFFPEKEFVFNRLSEQKNSSRFIFPENKSVLTAEVTCNFNGPTWKLPNKEIYKRVIKDLEKAEILREEEVEGFLVLKVKEVYPSYLIGYKDKLGIVLNYLSKFRNLISNGRPGLFNYNNMDHCMDMGIIGADHILMKKTGTDWLKTSKYFETYAIVD